jgi:hypothetical protein
MSSKTLTGRWVIEWRDRDPYSRLLVTRDTVDEVRELVRDILSDQTWTGSSDEGEAGQPAYEAFLNEEFGDDSDDQFLDLWSGVTFECDDGVLDFDSRALGILGSCRVGQIGSKSSCRCRMRRAA